MKYLIAIFLAVAGAAAHADTTTTTPTTPVFKVMKGAANLVTNVTPDAAACWKAALAATEASEPVAAVELTCSSTSKATLTFKKAPIARNAVCPANTFGTSFKQTATFTVVSKEWKQGPWLPVTPPAIECAPLAVKPVDQKRTKPCDAGFDGSFEQVKTSTYDASKNVWIVSEWTPALAPTGVCVPTPPIVVPPANATWAKITDEWGEFNVAANSTVRFGAGTRWGQKNVSGAGVCNSTFFGSDPAPGTSKTCEVQGTAVVEPTPPTPPVDVPSPGGEIVTNWVTIASEEYAPGTFTTSGVVRYGHDSRWVTKTINGSATCNGSTFGNADPAPGSYKECQIQLSAPNVTQTGGMPVINTALLPGPMQGYSVDRIAGSVGAYSDAGPFDIGAFRTNCGVSHFSFDDPIVYPGQPGKSHLHMFFGNTGMTGRSTVLSVATTGNSTCSGGTVNRTGYWVPAMVNLKTGAPVVASGSVWYYKSAYYGVTAESVKPFPAGLRMIAGSSANSTAAGASPYVKINCGASSVHGSVIPSCAVGDTVNLAIQFPQCWDGVNLDSPNHQSHMAYANNGCPSTHPVPLAEVSLNLTYMVTEAGTDRNWKLSSDNYVGQGGYSMHADWFNGWKEDIMKTWVENCVNKRASSSNALCDGRYLQ